ncbi:Hpt domain-containing protein [Formosa sp. PL04]|uniref:Hpt domain-containing protein n=1 Tax=Formosa sp. PL04 TaxID=3081755 RepID=UPI002982777A|nr:Hpt domain-containing protein [Formosa sp. PL04]MDW5290087.1 Hpt domain-containing protein [Formosa sp. PL04]
MEQHYKLYRVRELADNDEEFVRALALTFLEEIPEDLKVLKKAVQENNYNETYQVAHKLKPTIDLFEICVLDELIIVQEWGRLEQKKVDITSTFNTVITAIELAVSEIKSDFDIS